MPEIINIAELSIDTDSLVSSLSQTRESINTLTAAQKTLRADNQITSESYVRNEAALRTLRAEYNQGSKTLSNVTTATTRLNNALDTEVTSINEARQQNRELLALRNNLNLSTDEGRKSLEAINTRINENNEFVNENGSAYEQLKNNVGNYASGVLSTNPILANMATVLTEVRTALLAKNAAMIASSTSTGVMSGALRVFRLALASTGIGLIVVALGSLISFLTSSQAGIDKVTSVTRPLSALFSSLVGVLQKLGENLFNAFSNPQQTLKDLANFVQNNLINRFKAFGVILEGIINLDFQKIADGVLQAGTGVTNLTSKVSDLAANTGEFVSDALEQGTQIDNLTKQIEISENELILTRSKSLAQIKELELAARDAGNSTVERANAAQQAIEISNQLAKDELAIQDLRIERKRIENSLNDTSREDQAEFNRLVAERSNLEQAASTRELRFINQVSAARKEAKDAQKAANDQALKDEEERLKEESELRIQAAKFELNEFIRNNQSKLDSDKFFSEESLNIERKRLNDLANERRKFEETRLEEGKISEVEFNEAIAVINFDNAEKIAQAEATRVEAQKAAEAIDFENQLELDEDKFQNQFELESERLELQRMRDVAAAEATGADITLINQLAAREQEDVDRRLGAARLQQTANTFGGIAQLLGEHTAAGKAAAIAQATINTYQGISEVWASESVLPEPLATAAKVVSSGTVLAAGLNTVSQIRNTQTPVAERGINVAGGGLLGGKRHSAGGTLIEAEAGEVVINRVAAQNNLGLLSAINQSAGNGIAFAERGINVGGGFAGSSNLSSGLIDIDLLATQIATANAALPTPVVNVSDIQRVNNRTNIVRSIATL